MAMISYVTSALPGYNVSIREIHARIDRVTKILSCSDCVLRRLVTTAVDCKQILVYGKESDCLPTSCLNFYPWEPLHVIKYHLQQSIVPNLWPLLYFTYQEILSDVVDDDPRLSAKRYPCSSLQECNSLYSILKTYQLSYPSALIRGPNVIPVAFSLSIGIEIWTQEFLRFEDPPNSPTSFTLASSNEGRVVCRNMIDKLYVPVSSTVNSVFATLGELNMLNASMNSIKWFQISKQAYLTYISHPALQCMSSENLQKHVASTFPSSVELAPSDLFVSCSVGCNEEYILLADMSQHNMLTSNDGARVCRNESCAYIPISVQHANEQSIVLVNEEEAFSELQERCEQLLSLAFPFRSSDLMVSNQKFSQRCLTSINIQTFCSEFHKFNSPSEYTEYPSIVADLVRRIDSNRLACDSESTKSLKLKISDEIQIFPYLHPSEIDGSIRAPIEGDSMVATASSPNYPESDAIFPNRDPSFFSYLKFSNSFILEVLEYFWSLKVLMRKEIRLFAYDELFRYVCQLRNALSLMQFFLRNKMLSSHRKHSFRDPTRFPQSSNALFDLADIISIEDSDNDASPGEENAPVYNLPKRQKLSADERNNSSDYCVKREWIEID